MKQNIFNPTRCANYLRKDWTENGILLPLHFVLIYSGLTALFFWMDFTKTQSVVHALQTLSEGKEPPSDSYRILLEYAAQGIDRNWEFLAYTASICFIIYLAFTGSTFFMASKHKREYIADLTLPVSDAEKAITRWLRIALVPLPLFWTAAVLADFTRIGLIHAVYPEVSLAFPVPWTGNCGIFLSRYILEGYAIQALFILGATYWRKKPFPKTLSCLLLLGLLSFAVLFFNVRFFMDPIRSYHPIPAQWSDGWFYGTLTFLILFGYILSYIRMRRASLRVSWKDATTLALLIVAVIGLSFSLWMPHFIVNNF